MKCKILCPCVLFASLLVAATASAEYMVYDDFTASTLDMSKWSLGVNGTAPTLADSVATFDSASGTKEIFSTASYGYGSYKFKLGPTAPGSWSILGLQIPGSGGLGMLVRNDLSLEIPATRWDFHVGSTRNIIAAPSANDVLKIVWSATSVQLWNGDALLVNQTTGLPTATSANLQLTAYYGGGAMTVDSVSTNATPEPSTIILGFTGLISLLAYAWRKRK